MRQHLNFPDLVENGSAPFSNMVMDDDYVHLAGLVAADFPDGRPAVGDVAAETTAVMDCIGRMLDKVGLGVSDIVRTDVHMVDLDAMSAMNAAYAAFFPNGDYPARTTTQSAALFGGCQVEITCVARRRDG